jgi:hypothetical protein
MGKKGKNAKKIGKFLREGVTESKGEGIPLKWWVGSVPNPSPP